jgi:site-specific DNA-methyltransferase (cytosine-N4-specific)
MTSKDLLARVTTAYAESKDGRLDNTTLYNAVADERSLESKVPIGKSGQRHNLQKRAIRWQQQTLRQLGILERVDRGVWQIKEQIGEHLHRALASVKLIAYSTNLGMAIWAQNSSIFPTLDEPIALCITSPPYPLAKGRAYGNPTAAEYNDFITLALEPIVRNLLPGGSIILNVSNDIFEPQSPARSLYVERMVIALHDRLGLALMDRMPWVNLAKPPGPTQWASVHRYHMNSAHEIILWFTNDPMRIRSDNRRILEPHTETQVKLMRSGGERRAASYGDGAYTLRPESFSRITEGRIPKNVFMRGASCADTLATRRFAAEYGLPTHGAVFPTALPELFIKFLTQPDDLVVDVFGGTNKTGLAAERLGRRWLVTEAIVEYLAQSTGRFHQADGFELHPLLDRFAA